MLRKICDKLKSLLQSKAFWHGLGSVLCWFPEPPKPLQFTEYSKKKKSPYSIEWTEIEQDFHAVYGDIDRILGRQVSRGEISKEQAEAFKKQFSTMPFRDTYYHG